MAEKQILLIIRRAREMWNLRHVSIAHRIGVVPIAEPSIEIAVSSVHRKEALAAVQFLIDELKARARSAHTRTLAMVRAGLSSLHSLHSVSHRCRFGKRRCMRAKAVLGRRTGNRARPPSAEGRHYPPPRKLPPLLSWLCAPPLAYSWRFGLPRHGFECCRPCGLSGCSPFACALTRHDRATATARDTAHEPRNSKAAVRRDAIRRVGAEPEC